MSISRTYARRLKTLARKLRALDPSEYPTIPGRVWRRVRRRFRARDVTLSVVVPVYNVEEYLAECLDSLMRQDFHELEVIIIDDGSTDGSTRIARRYAREYRRIRYVRQRNGGLSAARNAGAKLARGRYLAFLDSDDMVFPHSYSTMIEQLESSGSDFALCSYSRYVGTQNRAPGPWISQAHAHLMVGVTLEEYPDILVSQVAWNKVYRMDFWRANGFEFPVGKLYEDQIVSTMAFARARGFDVIPNRLVQWRIRDSGTSITQASRELRNARGQIEAWESTLEFLEQACGKEMANRRRSMLFTNDLPRLIKDSVDAGIEYKDLVRTTAQSYLDEVGAHLWDEIRVQHRIPMKYLLDGDYDAVDRYVRETNMSFGDIPVFMDADGHPSADLAGYLGERGLPVIENNRVGHTQCRPVSEVRDWSVREDGTIRLRGWAYITNHDTRELPPRIELSLVDPAREPVPLTVEMVPDEEANLHSQSKFVDYSLGGFEATIDPTRLAIGAHYLMRVDIAQGRHAFERRLSKVRNADMKWKIQPVHTPQSTLMPKHQPYDGIAIQVDPAQPVLGRVVDRNGSSALIVSGSEYAGGQIEVHTAKSGVIATITPVLEDGEWLVSGLHVPSGQGGMSTSRGFGMRARTTAGRLVPIALTNVPTADLSSGRPSEIRRTMSGMAHLRSYRDHLEVTDIRLAAGAVDIVVRHLGSTGAKVTGTLSGKGSEFEGEIIESSDSTVTLRFKFDEFGWQRSPFSLPVGKYDVRIFRQARRGFSPHARLTFSPALRDRLPLLLEDDSTRIWAGTGKGRVHLYVETPIATASRSPFAQRALQQAYLASTDAIEPGSVLFRTYYGESVTDNALAVHEELVRTGYEGPLYWAIRDHSVRVPEGGVAVVYNSPDWYRLLGTAAVYIDNVHQPIYAVKKPGQVFVQTMHGYPFKMMGHGYWESAGYSQYRIDSFDRRGAEWDIFVSPASYATPLLKREFAYPGELAEIGYPRNDILVNGVDSERRQALRDRLGIAADKHVVLYAPTWRDYNSTSEFKSKMVEFVDYLKVAEALGPGYVLLIRGHQMNARNTHRVKGSAGVIDVTDYPEIRDLIIASDSAVLDYSSLRFDYALTDKPMIYLVPDLERYEESRGWLFDYRPTAPGPFVRNQDELVTAIRAARHSPERFAAERRLFRENYMELEDGHASRRLVDLMFGHEPARSAAATGTDDAISARESDATVPGAANA